MNPVDRSDLKAPTKRKQESVSKVRLLLEGAGLILSWQVLNEIPGLNRKVTAIIGGAGFLSINWFFVDHAETHYRRHDYSSIWAKTAPVTLCATWAAFVIVKFGLTRADPLGWSRLLWPIYAVWTVSVATAKLKPDPFEENIRNHRRNLKLEIRAKERELAGLREKLRMLNDFVNDHPTLKRLVRQKLKNYMLIYDHKRSKIKNYDPEKLGDRWARVSLDILDAECALKEAKVFLERNPDIYNLFGTLVMREEIEWRAGLLRLMPSDQ